MSLNSHTKKDQHPHCGRTLKHSHILKHFTCLFPFPTRYSLALPSHISCSGAFFPPPGFVLNWAIGFKLPFSMGLNPKSFFCWREWYFLRVSWSPFWVEKQQQSYGRRTRDLLAHQQHEFLHLKSVEPANMPGNFLPSILLIGGNLLLCWTGCW